MSSLWDEPSVEVSEEVLAFCRREFAFTEDVGRGGAVVGGFRGGRAEGLRRLRGADFARYAGTRNHLDGAVTRLSPYLRHGLVTLAEVRDEAVRRHGAREVEKLVSELAWREYYRRVYAAVGDRVWEDLELVKFGGVDRVSELPADLRSEHTGLACMDAFARELHETGYLHNHARMWLAAYVVHWRRTDWRAGAQWFLEHLLDGDPASNNLSWQWVASTFSHKPYFFNRSNIERYTDGRYCRECPSKRECPFAGEYETLERRLFPGPGGPEAASAAGGPGFDLDKRGAGARASGGGFGNAGGGGGGEGGGGGAGGGGGKTVSLRVVVDDGAHTGPPPQGDAVVWAHEDALSPEHPAHATGLPAVFTFDTPWWREQRYAFKRAVFLAESVFESVATLGPRAVSACGEPVDVVHRHARELGVSRVVVPGTPSPRVRQVARALAERGLKVLRADETPLAPMRGEVDLARFSRYWRKAEKTAFTPSAKARS